MNLTREQAKRLYKVFQDNTLRELDRLNIMDIVLMAKEEKEQEWWGIFFEQEPNCAIEGIKLIRSMLDCGLKEAKDLYDHHNPRRMAGRFGPFHVLETKEQAMNTAERLVSIFGKNAIQNTKIFIEEC